MLDTIRKQATGAYQNILTFFLCTTFFLLAVYLAVGMGNPQTQIYRLYFLMILQLAPAILVLTRGQFNFIIFVLINHFFVYSLAKYNLLEHIEKKDVIPLQTANAIMEMVYATLLILLSYYFTRFFVCRKKYFKDQFEFFFLSSRQYFWIGFFTCSQPFVSSFIPASLTTFYVVGVGSATVLLFCAKTENQVLHRQVKLALLISTYYSFLQSGSMSMMGSLGMIAGIIYIMEMKIKNFLILFLFGMTGICIQTVKLEYRTLNHAGAYSNAFEQVVGLGSLLGWKFLGGEMPSDLINYQEDESTDKSEEVEGIDLKNNLARGFARVGDDSLERVLQMTPSEVPFWDGESYEHIPYIFIPRVLWEGKPQRAIWNKFGRVYGFLSENDNSTSVGINFLAEAYMNFGFLGLYSMACIFGFMVACMESLSFHFLNRYTYFTFISFMIPFMNYGLDFASILNGSAFIVTVLLIIRYRLFSFLRRDAYSY